MMMKKPGSKWQDPGNREKFEKEVIEALGIRTTEINELNKAITKTLTKVITDHCIRPKQESKISPQTKRLMHKRRKLNNNNLGTQEMRQINKEITRNIRKDLKEYNKKHIQRTIEQNKSLKAFRCKLNNGRNEITRIKNKNSEITINWKEVLTVVEKFYTELYKSQRKIQNSPKATKRATGIINQGSEELSQIQGQNKKCA